jgi:tetratricopeptide (TPR) repeat protein
MPTPAARSSDQILAEARRLYAQAQFGAVVRLCKDLLRKEPRNAAALLTLGMAELAFDHFEESIAALTRAASLAPREPAVHLAIAAAHRRQGRFPEAHSAVDRALAIRPGEPASLSAKATLLCMEGEYQRAHDAVGPAVRAEPPPNDLGLAQVFGRACARLGKRAEGIEALESALARPGATGDRVAALTQLGELLDGEGQFDRAWSAYERAAAIRRQAVPFPSGAHSAAVDRAIAAWTPETVRSIPASGFPAGRLVFVVGMPRSGTTLVEQILASHPRAFGAGELLSVGRAVAAMQPVAAGPLPLLTEVASLTRAALERHGREVQMAAAKLNSTADRVVDKNPLNFLHLGVILRMLPGAKVIHCTRDPLDTCLSCFFNVASSLAWASDLESLGAFYRDYRRIMAHWRTVLTDLPVLDVAYEDLVAEPEVSARRIVEFTGLAWDPACLRFHENKRVALTPSIDQVRRPMYSSSVGRWRAYDRHLGPLAAAVAGTVGRDEPSGGDRP